MTIDFREATAQVQCPDKILLQRTLLQIGPHRTAPVEICQKEPVQVDYSHLRECEDNAAQKKVQIGDVAGCF